MKKIGIAVFLFLVVTLAVSGCSSASPTLTLTSTPSSSVITVVGHGEVKAAPDAAFMELAVFTHNPDLNVAIADNNQAMNDVLAFLNQINIPKEDIQTASLTIDTVCSNYGALCNDPAEFVVTNSIGVTVTDINRTSEVLSGCIDRGANNINQMYFFLQDPSPYILEARTNAVADAQNRAETLAAGLNRQLGPSLNVVEGNLIPPTIQEVNVHYGQVYYYGGRGGGDGGAIPIIVGSIHVTVDTMSPMPCNRQMAEAKL